MRLNPRPLALLVVAVVVALPLAAPPASASGPTVRVLVDFGDGAYRWAEVTLPETNVTALQATDLANTTWGLPSLEVSWYDSPFCLRSPCAFVDDIGNRNPTYPAWWHLYIWDPSDGWDLSNHGPSDVDLQDHWSIAWYLAIDDPNTFAAPRPVPTPSFPEVWTSFRGDVRNSGVTPGRIPVTNSVLWERAIDPLSDPPQEIDVTPVVADGLTIVSTRFQTVALDAETGAIVWRNLTFGSLLSTPAVYDDHLVLAGRDGRLHFVDLLTGNEDWRLVLETGVQSTGIASSPTVFEGRAYLGTFNETGGSGRVVAVNLFNGTIAWTYETGSVHMSRPAIDDGRLFVGVMGTYDGSVDFGPPFGLLCLWLNGTRAWFLPTAGPVASSPAVHGGVAYFTAKDGNLYAVRSDGTLAWNHTIGTSTSSPAVSGDRVYAASGGLGTTGSVYAFDLDGNLVWKTSTGPVQASPVTDGRLVCAAVNVEWGQRFCLRASDGARVWSHGAMGYVLGSLAVAGDTLYGVSDRGAVTAIRDRSPAEAPLLSVDLESPWRVNVTTSGRGRAHDATLQVELPAGFRMANETEAQAQVPRTIAFALGEMAPGEGRIVDLEGEFILGPREYRFDATLSYSDLAGRPYPPATDNLTYAVNPPPLGSPWALVGIGLAVVAVVIVGALAGFRRRRRRRA